ncbi:MAG: 5'-nucleotidase, lipoprotein e(P4) family [Pyrinomonadaceae bacterium]
MHHLKRINLLLLLTLAVFSSAVVMAQSQQADNTYIEAATLWQQASGEARALEYQTYVLARMLLDRDLRNHRIRMRRAVIVDVDETILDNSRYQGMLIKQGVNYPEGWTDWCNRAEATSIPGALAFLRYAHSRGARVFYVTNRKIAEKDGTVRNLKNLGFPEVNDETVLVRTDPQNDSKEPRRRLISSRYHVVLLMGDNLNDFSDVFEKSKTVASRIEATEKNKFQFGTHFIVLPNAMYGDWENAIYDYNFKLSSDEKQAKRRALLKD